jgi:hypothetical protein
MTKSAGSKKSALNTAIQSLGVAKIPTPLRYCRALDDEELELSLTDTRDQVISRRVFLPEEWPDAPEVLPEQGSLTVSFRLSLSVGEATPMAGYRALVFYP